MQSLKKDAEVHADESTALALVANQLQMTVRDLDALFQLDKAPVSIDRKAWLLEPGHTQEVSFGDLIEDIEALEPEDIVMSKMLQQILVDLFDSLPEREAGIIQLRFGLGGIEPQTLEQIGEIFGLTRERIRQIESKTMAKLRHPSRSDRLRDYLE